MNSDYIKIHPYSSFTVLFLLLYCSHGSSFFIENFMKVFHIDLSILIFKNRIIILRRDI